MNIDLNIDLNWFELIWIDLNWFDLIWILIWFDYLISLLQFVLIFFVLYCFVFFLLMVLTLLQLYFFLRMILMYLIPLQLMMGVLPSNELLTKYNLVQYFDLVKAIKSGDIKLFNTTLDKYQEYFIKKRVFLLLEKLRLLTFRTLFKKMWVLYMIFGSTFSFKKKIIFIAVSYLLRRPTVKPEHVAKIPLKLFHNILNSSICQLDIDIPEIECILANLIHRKMMRGYIAQKYSYLVLSDQDAFPSVLRQLE